MIIESVIPVPKKELSFYNYPDQILLTNFDTGSCVGEVVATDIVDGGLHIIAAVLDADAYSRIASGELNAIGVGLRKISADAENEELICISKLSGE